MTEPHLDPLAAALDSVGDRWTLLLVEALLDGPRRFGDLQEELPGIAPNVLSQRLRRLEGEGLVLAQPYSRAPAALRLRADRRRATSWPARCGCWPTGAPATASRREPPRHDACGTPVEARWWCPTCEQPVGEEDAARPALRLIFTSD